MGASGDGSATVTVTSVHSTDGPAVVGRNNHSTGVPDVVSVIDCLPEEHGRDLPAGRARIERLTLLTPVPADGPVECQCCHNPGEESLSEGDEALGVRPVAVLGEADLGSRLSHPYGYRGSRVRQCLRPH